MGETETRGIRPEFGSASLDLEQGKGTTAGMGGWNSRKLELIREGWGKEVVCKLEQKN
jgi:hypothetical protein